METLTALCRRLLVLTEHLRFLPPLAARVAVGVVFASTGWGKLHDLETVTGFFRDLGIPYPELQAPFVATVELVGGCLLVLGLASRVAAVFLASTMVVALKTAIWPDVSGLTDLLGRVEMLYLVLFTWIAIAGPGAVSLDGLLLRAVERTPEPGMAFKPQRA